MGLGHFGGGVAAARWLARQGAVVTVTDLADEHVLAESLALLRREPIGRLRLGGHREEDFRNADLVVVNPAVRPGDPLLELARLAGARLTSEIQLFLEACPASVVGITGSNGKSTTAAMIAAILQADGRRTWLGGNIGNSLLCQLDEISPEDWAVLELSSFQLWHLGPEVPLPQVAVVTNCTPNHLNWHDSYEDYMAAKQRIVSRQRAEDLAVLNDRDAEVRRWSHLVRGRRLPLVPPDNVPPLTIPGEHNRINAACAAAAALGVGCSESSVRRGLRSFRGLPQRLEPMAVIAGRRFYSDASATTPESTVAALQSLEGPIWLLAGGSDKGCDFRPLGRAIAENARGTALFGEVRETLHGCITTWAPTADCVSTESLSEALHWCWERSGPGDAILLSPACPSGLPFTNYRQRGRLFEDLARRLVAQPNR
ncbi:MAG: UDP-N-acetylmuramoyl-L-alanine--D-glutamate ligase [Pirellulales bacterium]|nr:UDP-N-acetylmuramoyl-L-alanine--D-glutamate ligase [Pirellulales bacterium]